ncbi:MAG TPA: phospho-sugar mutase [Spirochaetota bacterium]|nr:phospho-sugar mutase [Spirochaetota bacterium]
MKLNDKITDKIGEWTNSPYSEECISEIKKLVSDNNETELNERFALDLDFGTGGMRGIIRNGSNGMNIFVVAKATQGLANYVKKSEISNPKAAIAYDSRRFSFEFAKEAALVLASNGIKTYLFKELRPTPELSFAIRYLGCTTGIVVTASHNPKEYNGYKVYWNDGAQVVAPHDKGIIEEVKKVLKLIDVKKENFDELVEKGMIEWIGENVDNAFIEEILKLNINKSVISKSKVKIVFTPLHGTGATLIPEALKRLGFNDVTYVEKQMKADSEFSTVIYPNPEEREALKLGTETAEKINADIVIATDPDADRMGIVVRDSDGKYDIITGNQIGSIIEYYILSKKKENNSIPANAAIVKTIVTTNLQDEIAQSFGVKVFNVLTGFKFIGQKIREFEDDNSYQYIFGGEESYGFLCEDFVRDKDAVSACTMLAETAAWAKDKGLTLYQLLQNIYVEYGFSKEAGISVVKKGKSGAEEIEAMMKHFRENPLTQIAGSNVTYVYDYATLKGLSVAENEKITLDMPTTSNVIQYFTEDNTKVSIRPSGTEPKIKFYCEVHSKVKNLEELPAAELAAQEKINQIKISLGI